MSCPASRATGDSRTPVSSDRALTGMRFTACPSSDTQQGVMPMVPGVADRRGSPRTLKPANPCSPGRTAKQASASAVGAPARAAFVAPRKLCPPLSTLRSRNASLSDPWREAIGSGARTRQTGSRHSRAEKSGSYTVLRLSWSLSGRPPCSNVSQRSARNAPDPVAMAVTMVPLGCSTMLRTAIASRWMVPPSPMANRLRQVIGRAWPSNTPPHIMIRAP